MTRVVVAQDSVDVRRGQDLTDDVEHGVIVKRVADLLEFLKESLKDLPLDRVRRDEVEDQAIAPLPISMDPTHPLFQPVRIPGNVVIEEDVANLKVDPFARSLGCHEDLDLALAKLLFGMQPGARLFAASWLHAAVDEADAE